MKRDEFIVTSKSMLLDKRLGKPNPREFYGVLLQLSQRGGIAKYGEGVSPNMAREYRQIWRGGIAKYGGGNNKRLIIKDYIKEDDYASVE